MKFIKSRSGFTLMELIVSIAVLAVLVAIVAVAINPGEQLRRSRDSKRVGDLTAVKTALDLYMGQATSTINLSGDSSVNSRCIGGGGTATFFANTASGALAAPGGTLTALATSTTQAVPTATGNTSWIPALMGLTPGGAPISNLPLDPTNGDGTLTTYYYGYGCRSSNLTYELTARLESTYYRTDLNSDGLDGGNSTSTYELGTDLTIVPDTF